MKVKLINKDIRENYGYALLQERGVLNVDRFLHPTEQELQSYNDLDNIQLGVQLIDRVMRDNSTPYYGIIVDSDVDGMTSAAIFVLYMQKLYPQMKYKFYLHSGKQHGFSDLYQDLLTESFDFIVAPDSASNDSAYIQQFNIPVLIIDHHIAEKELSDNMILVNNQTSTKYHNKYLSGAGMVYQFCRALDDFYNQDLASQFIDLAAVGIIGDMMSGLECENQFLWKQGLSKIYNRFLQILIERQSFSIGVKDSVFNEDKYGSYLSYEPQLTPMNIAFYIVPLINAMIRVGTQEEKERLFLAFINPSLEVPCNKRGCKGTFEKVCLESARECINAKAKQNRLKEQISAQLEKKIADHNLLDNQILFITLDDNDIFPSELNGLIATQLANKYKKPTMIGRLSADGYLRGSIRNINNSELESFKGYLDNTHLMEYVLGHCSAAGFSLAETQHKALMEKANQDLAIYNFGDSFYNVNFVRTADSNDLSDLIRDLDQYKNIWSQNCEEPLIYIKQIHLNPSQIQVIGKSKNTIKFLENGITYIKFFATDMIDDLECYDNEITLEIVGKANLNHWNGATMPQIIIENYDVVSENSILDF